MWPFEDDDDNRDGGVSQDEESTGGVHLAGER